MRCALADHFVREINCRMAPPRIVRHGMKEVHIGANAREQALLPPVGIIGHGDSTEPGHAARGKRDTRLTEEQREIFPVCALLWILPIVVHAV